MKNKEKKIRRLSRFSLITLISVYFLILVGGIVRSTGSGMGCPDWPKCFGQWIPPTSAEELPTNYKEIYAEQRHEKNVRFANYLSLLGMDNKAERLLTDESIKEEADFNTFKTWTEYINRLIGALIGVFILSTFYFSVPFIRKEKSVFYAALATLVLVLIQAWIGSIVVSTNLITWMVTIHMFIALIIVALLVFIVNKTHENWKVYLPSRTVKLWLVLCMVVVLIQIFLGTQVRESIDQIASSFNYEMRGSWVANLGNTFSVHRSFSWVILLSHVVLFYFFIKRGIKSMSLYLIGVIILLSMFTGITLNYLDFPAAAQPIHLLLGTVLFGVQFLLFLQLENKKVITINS